MLKTVHFQRPALQRIVILRFGTGPGSGGSKRLIFKGRACTESSFFWLWRRFAMGIAAGRVAWVALCHADCWWASRVGAAVPCGLLGSASSRWRRVLGIADQGVVWVAPCH